MEAVGNISAEGTGLQPSSPLRLTYRYAAPRRLRVLLAEDDDDLRFLLAGALRKDGYEVLEARDGAELLAQLRGVLPSNTSWTASTPPPAPPDVVVSDVMMPGATGLEVLTAVHRAQIGTPVVLITAFGAPETHAEARRLGAVAVLDKPFELADLRRLLRKIAPGENGRCSGGQR